MFHWILSENVGRIHQCAYFADVGNEAQMS